MNEEHAIAFLAVGAVAFMVGWQLCKKRAQQAAAATPAAQQQQAEAAPSNQVTWLMNWGGGIGGAGQ